MAFKEQEKITKNYSQDLLTELINYQGDNLMGEIVRLGIQQLMDWTGKNISVLGVMSVEKNAAAKVTVINPGSCTLVLALWYCVYHRLVTESFILPYWSVISAARKRWY